MLKKSDLRGWIILFREEAAPYGSTVRFKLGLVVDRMDKLVPHTSQGFWGIRFKDEEHCIYYEDEKNLIPFLILRVEDYKKMKFSEILEKYSSEIANELKIKSSQMMRHIEKYERKIFKKSVDDIERLLTNRTYIYSDYY